MKKKNSTKTRKQNKNKVRRRAKRPRNVWNSLRKLEDYLRKADLQANIFEGALGELREKITFETRAGFIDKLCNSIHGDLLNAFWTRRRMAEENQFEDKKHSEADVILHGVFEVLLKFLDLHPHKCEGERFFLTRETARQYEFDEIPRKLDDERVQKVEVEVLRCGWKIGDRIVQKPKVFVVS